MYHRQPASSVIISSLESLGQEVEIKSTEAYSMQYVETKSLSYNHICSKIKHQMQTAIFYIRKEPETNTTTIILLLALILFG